MQLIIFGYFYKSLYKKSGYFCPEVLYENKFSSEIFKYKEKRNMARYVGVRIAINIEFGF